MAGGGLHRHLRRTYGAMIALVLAGVAFVIGLVASMAQFNHLGVETRESLSVYADRARREGRIDTLAQVARIVSGTSHPGWTLTIAVGDARYIARWAPYGVTVEPRNAMLVQRRSIGTTDVITGLANLLGAPLPAHIVVNDADLALSPNSSMHSIVVRTFGLTIVAAIILVIFAFAIAERMASDTLRPLRALHQALGHMADSALDPHSVSEVARDELGELIATYNRAIEAANKARAERDAAEARTHEFIADAGHQLRTPLTVLSGFVGILRKGQLRHPDDAPKMLGKMEQQIAIMKKLVERLMLLESWHSDDEHPMCERTDIGEFVTAVVDPIAVSHPEIAVRMNALNGAIGCIDSAELTYAITNVVANAIKYAPDGGITVDVTADEKAIYIAIADQGPGIPPDALPHVFDRFYRGSRRDVPGSGLGLAIAKTAVERAHGTLSVESRLGEGARFTIRLPRLIDPVAAVT